MAQVKRNWMGFVVERRARITRVKGSTFLLFRPCRETLVNAASGPIRTGPGADVLIVVLKQAQ